MLRGLVEKQTPSPHPSPPQVGPARQAHDLMCDPGEPGAREREPAAVCGTIVHRPHQDTRSPSFVRQHRRQWSFLMKPTTTPFDRTVLPATAVVRAWCHGRGAELGHVVDHDQTDLQDLGPAAVQQHRDAELLVALGLEGIEAGHPDLETSDPFGHREVQVEHGARQVLGSLD